jgi:hypothetical protein
MRWCVCGSCCATETLAQDDDGHTYAYILCRTMVNYHVQAKLKFKSCLRASERHPDPTRCLALNRLSMISLSCCNELQQALGVPASVAPYLHELQQALGVPVAMQQALVLLQ